MNTNAAYTGTWLSWGTSSTTTSYYRTAFVNTADAGYIKEQRERAAQQKRIRERRERRPLDRRNARAVHSRG